MFALTFTHLLFFGDWHGRTDAANLGDYLGPFARVGRLLQTGAQLANLLSPMPPSADFTMPFAAHKLHLLT